MAKMEKLVKTEKMAGFSEATEEMVALALKMAMVAMGGMAVFLAATVAMAATGEAHKSMPNKTEAIYIFWTCRDKQEAKKIIHGLLGQQLIACASIFPEVESIYRWEGKIEESREIKVILKTQPKHFDTVQSYIQTHCSYEAPEVLQVDIVQGNPRYLSWIVEETSFNNT